jgi:Uma2 family endonuclease
MLIQEQPSPNILFNSSFNGKYLLNINQYHQMIEHGIFTENDKIELIKGELISMSPVGIKHAFVVRRLTALLSQKFGDRSIIDIQNPILLDDNSEPEPDVVVLKPRDDFYQFQLPRPDDLLLIIEVSDTTLKYDRTVKIPLYSEAKIREIWIIDINSECVEIYRYANTEGYDQMQRYRLGETLSILAFPDLSLTVNDIFGK